MINIAARMQTRETCDAHRNCKGSRFIPIGNVSNVMVGWGVSVERRPPPSRLFEDLEA